MKPAVQGRPFCLGPRPWTIRDLRTRRPIGAQRGCNNKPNGYLTDKDPT